METMQVTGFPGFDEPAERSAAATLVLEQLRTAARVLGMHPTRLAITREGETITAVTVDGAPLWRSAWRLLALSGLPMAEFCWPVAPPTAQTREDAEDAPTEDGQEGDEPVSRDAVPPPAPESDTLPPVLDPARSSEPPPSELTATTLCSLVFGTRDAAKASENIQRMLLAQVNRDVTVREREVLAELFVRLADEISPVTINPLPALAVTPLGAFADDLAEVMAEAQAMLHDKNRKYGDSALNPLRAFSKLDAIAGIKVRVDDKVSRLIQGEADEDEDVEQDLLGYLLLLRMARLRAARART